jgi:hypothetical protein
MGTMSAPSRILVHPLRTKDVCWNCSRIPVSDVLFFSLHHLHLQYANRLSTLNNERLHKYALKACVIKSQYVKNGRPFMYSVRVCVFVCVVDKFF